MKKMKKSNEYYVYEWIRLDTNEPFYVGKGKGNRWKDFNHRNSYFKKIVNKHFSVVNILHDNLNEETAFGLESYYIWLYRDVIGYEMCNFNDGGEGCALKGENNPMYGKYGKDNPNYGKHHTEEARKKMSEGRKGKCVGENNPMYGNGDKIKGENNPMYGKCHSEDTKDKISKANKGKNIGTKHWRHKFVICLTTMEIFSTLMEASRYYNLNRSHLTTCCKGFVIKNDKKYKRNYCGKLPDGTPLKWMYLDDFLEQCEYTLL